MLTLFDLLKTYSIDSTEVRLVRHGNAELNVYEAFKGNIQKFVEYSSWQTANKFRDSKYILMFCPARGTTALFLGLWEITGVTKNDDLTSNHKASLRKFELPLDWYESSDRYELIDTQIMSDLSERLVIDWGGSTVSWVQKKNKEVVEIKPINSIGDFVSYDDILLQYQDLKRLISDSASNPSWVNALSSVNGVYLIKYKLDGRLYVGSAYGKDGFLGRWTAYANTGHGGNKLLKALEPELFEYSILEICPATMSADNVIARENRWKNCLGTRDFGLNDN